MGQFQKVCILSFLILILECKKLNTLISEQTDLSYWCGLLNIVCSFMILPLGKHVCLPKTPLPIH